MMRAALLCFVIALSAVSSKAESRNSGPDCSGKWPTTMALVHLKNASLIDPAQVNSAKTKTTRMASQQIGDDLWHQVYDVEFTLKSGESIEAIAVHNASDEECSMTGVEVFVVSKKLNAQGE